MYDAITERRGRRSACRPVSVRIIAGCYLYSRARASRRFSRYTADDDYDPNESSGASRAAHFDRQCNSSSKHTPRGCRACRGDYDYRPRHDRARFRPCRLRFERSHERLLHARRRDEPAKVELRCAHVLDLPSRLLSTVLRAASAQETGAR